MYKILKSILIIVIMIEGVLLTGCQYITQENTNYARVGLFQDRFDGMFYHYVEAGKTINLNENNSINTFIGYQEGGDNKVYNTLDNNIYWELNYQLTF